MGSWSVELGSEAPTLRRLDSRTRQDFQFWGLLGRMTRSRQAVLGHQEQIQAALDTVVKAPGSAFPDIAIDAMRKLATISDVGWATQTLLLSLARPSRLLPLTNPSRRALGELSGNRPTTLGEPENYRKLLRWLYQQPWYADGPPIDDDEELVRIYGYRAALVDSFVWETT